MSDALKKFGFLVGQIFSDLRLDTTEIDISDFEDSSLDKRFEAGANLVENAPRIAQQLAAADPSRNEQFYEQIASDIQGMDVNLKEIKPFPDEI